MKSGEFYFIVEDVPVQGWWGRAWRAIILYKYTGYNNDHATVVVT